MMLQNLQIATQVIVGVSQGGSGILEDFNG